MWMLTAAGALLAILVAVLLALLGWMGSKFYSKLEELNGAVNKIAGDFHGKISELDRRMVKVETRCETRYMGEQ
jgi:uncharacterized protein YoxC